VGAWALWRAQGDASAWWVAGVVSVIWLLAARYAAVSVSVILSAWLILAWVYLPCGLSVNRDLGMNLVLAVEFDCQILVVPCQASRGESIALVVVHLQSIRNGCGPVQTSADAVTSYYHCTCKYVSFSFL
jgi:hypothetical protein